MVNFYTKGHLQHRKLLFVLLFGANIFNRLYLYKQLLTLDPNISLSCIFIVDCYLFTFMRAAVRQIFQTYLSGLIDVSKVPADNHGGEPQPCHTELKLAICSNNIEQDSLTR